MGGLGSGRWYRWDSRDTLEGNRRIDVRQLQREDWLRPGLWFSWAWWRSVTATEGTGANGRMWKSRCPSSGHPATTGASAPGLSAPASLMASNASAGWRSYTEPVPISSAATATGWPTPVNGRTVLTGRYDGPAKLRSDWGTTGVLPGPSRPSPGGCAGRLTSGSSSKRWTPSMKAC
jgi:hypothetical protein